MHGQIADFATGLNYGVSCALLNHIVGRPIPVYGWVIAWLEARDRRNQHA